MLKLRFLAQIILFIFDQRHCYSLKNEEFSKRIENAHRALEYVYRIQSSRCTGGTEEKLYLQFNHSAWIRFTEIALRTGNLFTKIIVSHNNSLDSLTDEMFYTLVRNNVHGEPMLYGSAVAIAPGLYKYDQFCPYAHRKNDSISVHDVAVNYDYHINTTEWWYGPKSMDFDNVTIVKDTVLYRSGNELLPGVEEEAPVAQLSDGYWTKPYYDCGGGDIWMVTYLAPIFGLNYTTRKPFFSYRKCKDENKNMSIIDKCMAWQINNETYSEFSRGIASIDIELTLLDINQCDSEGKLEGAIDVFRGTHHCLPSTKCIPISGLGFRRGAYKCICKDGFYFPNIAASGKFFLGMDIEEFRTETNFDAHYSCIRCAPGCYTCVDNSPCLYDRNMVVRIMILLLTFFTIFAIIGVSFVTYIYRSEMAIKTASPVFLQLMCLGCLLMCFHLFVIFPEPTDILCAIKGWPIYVGFVLMYGALVLKTWRISVIFRVGSVQRINLPDHVLLHRLIPFLGVTVGYLAAWTAANPPRAETFRSESGLKYQYCTQSWWSYAGQGAEVGLLLSGCYLCFTVRKAPAHFNESKKIAWAIYNAIILGSFNLIITIFIGYSAGPDALYVLSFIRVQVYVIITVCFIFGPKFWVLYKRTDISESGISTTMASAQSGFSVTGRIKKPATSTLILERLSRKATHNRATQTSPDVFLDVPKQQTHGRHGHVIRTSTVVPEVTRDARHAF